MTSRHSTAIRHRRTPRSQRDWWAAPVACLATLLALPASAGMVIPTDPLTSEKRLPPNIVFILDDSSSMGLVAMPAAVRETNDGRSRYISGRTGLQDNPTDRSYTNNTIYYNPETTYRPWVRPDGTRYTGGMEVDRVFTSLDNASGTGNSVGTCGTNAVNPNAEQFCSLVGSINSVFYVPNPSKGYTPGSTNADHYDRYSIQSVNGTPKVGITRGDASLGTWNVGDLASGSMRNVTSIQAPAGAGPVTITITNGSGRNSNADLYVRQGGWPTTSNYDYRDNSAGNAATVTINNPGNGTWYVSVRNAGRGQLSNARVTATYLDFVEGTPTGRSQEDELRNIATWYSYYRTRIKTAKGGASETFASLGRDFRIGYTSINSVDRTDNIIPIDVDTNGEFFGGNKSSFFTSLQGASSGNGNPTPLRRALASVGDYFARTDSRGPWGPGTSEQQFSCRQNFAILTTDGYWSSGTTYSEHKRGNIGNEDGNAGRPYADGSSDTLADVAYYYWNTDLRTDMDDNVPTSDADGNNNRQHMNTFTVSIGLEGNLRASDYAALVAGTKSWPSLASSNNSEIKDKIDDLWHAAINGRGDFLIANNPTEFTNALNSALATISGRAASYSNVASNSVSLNTGTQVFNASYVSGSWAGYLTARNVSSAGVGEVKWTASIPEARKVLTRADAGATLVNFPTANQINWLGGEDIANYIKGDRSGEKSEGGTFRDRTTVLGDIVGSSPEYVRDTKTVYVGANDGMLHAFDADTGEELFAYVPRGINWQELASLADPNYTHRFFVDGPIVVSNRTQTPDKNILVGALGKGGKGLYALDVTDPLQPAFRWELNQGAMGLVMGKPILGTTPDGKNAVILGNGVNSSNDRAVLIIVNDYDTGAPTVVEIDTGVGSADAPNGLSAPTGVYGPDGKTIAYVYAGDMLGNVWKFDIANRTARRLFTAGASQPITAGVTVATEPRTGKRWIFFGTGRYLLAEDANPLAAGTQSMYGFIDEEITDDEEPEVLEPGDLVDNTPEAWTTGTVAGMNVRAFKEKTALPAGAKGWRVDLPAGERIVQDAQVVSTFLITASMTPSTGTDPCRPDGSGFVNALDAFTGTSAGGSYFNVDGDPTTNDTVGGLPIGSVDLGSGMPTLPNLLRGLIVVGGTGGPDPSGVLTLAPRWDRASWREIRGD